MIQLSPISEVISDFRDGKMVIIVDDADRENEGDLSIATEKVTPEALAFMLQHARGLICTSISEELGERLKLPYQTLNNNSPYRTPFTVSIDLLEVVPSGITAAARCRTMQRMLEGDATADDFVSPGNVFPLIANPAGVIGRQGQTEGSYDLARLAGLQPSGVICEVMNPDGTMARGDELNRFSEQHGIKITSVQEIIQYRIKREILVREVGSSFLDTDYGRFRVIVFEDDVDGKEHLGLVYGDICADSGRYTGTEAPLVRVHSECLTGDVFTSRRCDCARQLEYSMREIVREGAGILLYLRQEGRGIGLLNKLRAYELQDRGLDTVEANVELGFQPDERNFAVAAKMLGFFQVDTVRLLTNNPEKLESLHRFGISVAERVAVSVPEDEYSQAYLECKREKLGHLL